MTSKPHLPEWLFLLALCAVAALAELGFVIVNISALPVFLKSGLHLPNLPGLALASYYFVEAVANSPMGGLADRIGRRRLMVIGTGLSILTCLATSQLRTPSTALTVAGVTTLVLLLRALDGLGAAMLWPNVYASTADHVAPERQAQANTLITMAYMATIAIGPKVGGYLNDTFGAHYSESQPGRYAPSFYFAAGCFAATAVLTYFVAPRRGHVIVGAEHKTSVSKNSLVQALKRIPWLFALIFLIFVAIGLIAPYVKPYFMERFKITEESFGNLLLGPAIVIGIVSTPLGRLADRWGKSRAIRLGTGLCAAALWGFLFAHNHNMILLFGTLLGVGFVMAYPAYMAFVSDLAPEKERGGMIGAVRMAQGAGAMFGSVVSSPLYTVGTGHHFIFYLAASILTGGFILSMLVVREGKTPAAEE